TTAGSYPGPVALPAPTPMGGWDNVPPQISNLTATRLSFTSIELTWDTDEPTIGLACAGSSVSAASEYKYNVYSLIEDTYGTSHSAVITTLPMSIPTHFSVLSKDETGNSSYAPDQTIGITPDGTQIFGGTNSNLTPTNTMKLVTNYGEWSFGPAVAPAPFSHDTVHAQYYPTLNGKKVAMQQGNLPATQTLMVGENGNIYGLFDENWWYFYNYQWYSNTNAPPPTEPPPPGPPPSPAINPPYAVSADDSALTGTTGTLTTADGVWAIRSDGKILLNGLWNQSSGDAFGLTVSQLQVNAHGQMFALDTEAVWRVWLGYEWQPTTGPQSGPIPVDINISRTRFDTPHNSTPGFVMAELSVTTSDGTVYSGSNIFPGTYSVGLDGNGQQSGSVPAGTNNLVYGLSYTYSSSGGFAQMLVTATQNGSSF